jgi:hypothetical protein
VHFDPDAPPQSLPLVVVVLVHCDDEQVHPNWQLEGHLVVQSFNTQKLSDSPPHVPPAGAKVPLQLPGHLHPVEEQVEGHS